MRKLFELNKNYKINLTSKRSKNVYGLIETKHNNM